MFVFNKFLAFFKSIASYSDFMESHQIIKASGRELQPRKVGLGNIIIQKVLYFSSMHPN